jgi:hypothetical protein
MSGKHPKKHNAIPDAEPAAPSPSPASDVSAAELRAQMSILAEQVRRLGDRVGGTGDAWSAPVAKQPVVESPAPSASDASPPAAPSQRPSDPPPASAAGGMDVPPSRAHVVSVPLAYVRPAAVAHAGPPPPEVVPAPAPVGGHDEDPIADGTSRLLASVLAMAERAAEQIRERAEHEAAAIRANAAGGHAPEDRHTPDLAPPAPSGALDLAASQTGLDVLERQRQALAALAAETDHIEAATERLRAQARALDAERQRLYDAIGAARRDR